MFSGNPIILMLTANNKYFALNFIFLLCLLFFALTLIYLFRKQGNGKILIYLLLYHTFMSLVYYFFQPWPPLDTAFYYSNALNSASMSSLMEVGGNYVSLMLYPLVKYLHISFFSGFMLFNFIGFLGLMFFYMALKGLINGHIKATKFLNIVIFLPGISFWTAPICKESPIFLGIMLVLYSLITINKRVHYFLLGSAPILLIRPYIYAAILLAILLSMLSLGKTKVTSSSGVGSMSCAPGITPTWLRVLSTLTS